MATKKLGSVKNTDLVLVTAVALGGSDVSGTLGVGNGGTGQSTYTNGQLLIGNTTGNTLTKATLTQGNSIAITNGTGSITIAVGDGDKGDVTVSGSGATWVVDSLSQAVSLTGIITPTALSANTDNWAPTGLSTASVIRASASTFARDLTGIDATGVVNGRTILLINVGSLGIYLRDDATSTAANRFQIPGGDLYLRADDNAALLQYDTTVSRWRVLATTGYTPSILTPSSIGADQTDYNPTGLANASIVRLSSSGDFAIKSIATNAASLPIAGRLLTLVNVNTSTGNITLNHLDSSGTSSYQIKCPLWDGAGANYVIAPGASVTLFYDITLSKWSIIKTAGQAMMYVKSTAPSALAADTNDYAPASQSSNSLLRISASTQERKVTGIVAPPAGKVELWANVGSVPVIFKDDSASSTAANRIAMPTDLILLPDDVVMTVYDATSTRYRPVAALPINVPRVIHQSTTQTTFSSSTAENTLLSATVPAHWMGPDGGFDFVVHGLVLNNATASMTFTFRIKFGATTLWSEAITIAQHTTSHRPLEIRGYLNNIGSLTSQYLFSRMFIGSQGTGAGTGGVGAWAGTNLAQGGQVGNATSSADTKSDQTFAITCQMNFSGANAQTIRTFSRCVLTRTT